MTPKEYKSRIEALGCPTGAAWARFVRIAPKTHQRHLMSADKPNSRRIPDTLIMILEALESGDMKNPWRE